MSLKKRVFSELENADMSSFIVPSEGGGGNMVLPETLYPKDDALLYIAYVMLIWGAPIPADRWHCRLWP